MWLVLDRTKPHRIELLAVPEENRDGLWREQPQQLESWQPQISSSAEVQFVRDEGLPIDTALCISLDGVLTDEGRMWPAHITRAGAYNESGPIFNGPTGPGLGLGELGAGPVGYGGTYWRWHRDRLPPGEYPIEAATRITTGEDVTTGYNLTAYIDHLPQPVHSLAVAENNSIGWQID